MASVVKVKHMTTTNLPLSWPSLQRMHCSFMPWLLLQALQPSSSRAAARGAAQRRGCSFSLQSALCALSMMLLLLLHLHARDVVVSGTARGLSEQPSADQSQRAEHVSHHGHDRNPEVSSRGRELGEKLPVPEVSPVLQFQNVPFLLRENPEEGFTEDSRQPGSFTTDCNGGEASRKDGLAGPEKLGGTHWTERSRAGARERDRLEETKEQKGSNRTLGIVATLSGSGLSYAKQVAVDEILGEILPLSIPDIFVPFYSCFAANLSRITLWTADVPDADIDIEPEGITAFAGSLTAHLTFDWWYGCEGYFADWGNASVKIHQMSVGALLNLTAVSGGLHLVLLDEGVIIDRLEIELSGGFSPLYAWLIASFTNHLRAAVEAGVGEGLRQAAEKLNVFFEGLPRQVAVDSVAAIDASLPTDPSLLNTSITLATDGRFIAIANCSQHREHVFPPILQPAEPLSAVACDSQGSPKMVSMVVQSVVATSASQVYFEAGSLAYEISELPSSSPLKLNTHSWRFLLPRLSHTYPNRNMTALFNVTQPPGVAILEAGIEAEVKGQLVMSVVGAEGVRRGGQEMGQAGVKRQGGDGDDGDVPVFAIGLSLACTIEAVISGNNLTAAADLGDMSMQLDWSDVGSIPTHALSVIIVPLVRLILLPALNRRLQDGFPLPIIPGIELQNSTVVYQESRLLVCSDIKYTGGIFGLERGSEEAHAAHDGDGQEKVSSERYSEGVKAKMLESGGVNVSKDRNRLEQFHEQLVKLGLVKGKGLRDERRDSSRASS